MCGVMKECLLQRYFSKEVRSGTQGSESDIVQACRRLLDERQSLNVLRFLQAINQRYDLTDGLRKLQCRMLIFVGDSSPFHSEALHMNAKLNTRTSLVEVEACGSLVTEEQPHAMVTSIELFLTGYGFYRQPPVLSPNYFRGPTSPLRSFPSVLPELLSPESLGLKLKPIKTRATIEV